MNLEKFNRTGMRDAYNVMKLLQNQKGGEAMGDPEDKVIHPEEEAQKEEPQDEELELDEDDDEEDFDDEDEEDEDD